MPTRTLIQTADDLPNLPKGELMCVDVETTSFDDKTPSFQPFQGHRISGYAFCTADGQDAWYLPLRHHGSDVAEGHSKNYPLQEGIAFMKSWMEDGRDIVNHNIKFDARFWHFDGIHVKGELIDTMALARIVDNDRMSYSLDALTGRKKDPTVSAYCKKLKTKDYGRTPILIMSPYAMNDTVITVGLYDDQLRQLPDDSLPVWDVERKLTKHLVEAEIHGVNLNIKRTKKIYAQRLAKAIELEEKVHEEAGIEFDVNSEPSITKTMLSKFGVEPVAWTAKGNPQWTAETLKLIPHPVAQVLADCRGEYHFCSLFCDGWLKRVGEDKRLHTDFRQSGTRTGRMSCSDPNFMNVIQDAKYFIDPDEDCDIVSFDFSQIEYRLFAHYSGNEELIESYAKNPDQDYHQALADMLGISRRLAKTLNFAFLYGMGKKKLLRNVFAIARAEADNPKVMEAMTGFLPDWDGSELTDADFEKIAANIYQTYHRRVPSVRQLGRRVQDKIYSHGWIRNYRGRHYRFPDTRWAYKGLNYLIQGSAADIFKERLLAVLEAFPYARLITNVYDDVVFSVPRDKTVEFYNGCKEVLMDVKPVGKVPALRVPLLVEGKVSRRSWGDCVVVDEDTTVEQALRLSIENAKHAA